MLCAAVLAFGITALPFEDSPAYHVGTNTQALTIACCRSPVLTPYKSSFMITPTANIFSDGITWDLSMVPENK